MNDELVQDMLADVVRSMVDPVSSYEPLTEWVN